ncbi:class I SAM-dependent methyltransferase [Lentzea roselyniae]|uniref:Class I SAM-dependent methyltransferase n=2 Tax=Lentzea roselyniae TaxID=531940 RepID=A0ABP7CHM8_9PSEU
MERYVRTESADTINDFLYFMEDRYAGGRTEREGNVIWALAELTEGGRVLDLACGWGRISRYLTDRGADVVGVDINETMLEAARRNAPKATFVAADMRELPDLGTFDAVIIWWSSFGFFDDGTDQLILRKLRENLRPGGKLLVEHANAAQFFIEAAANPKGKTTAQRIGDDVMVDTRRLSDDGRRVVGNRQICRNSRVNDMPYDMRLFSGSEIEYWLAQAGYTDVAVLDRGGDPLTWQSYGFVASGTAPAGDISS